MQTQANKLKNIVGNQTSLKPKNTKFITVTSGKGGVGKSMFSANLANVLTQNGYKVGVFDADIGLANMDVMLNVKIKNNLLDVMKGNCKLTDIIIQVNPNLILIPGESGDEILKYSDQFIYERFSQEIQVLEGLDYMIVDTGAGIGETMQIFLDIADEVIIVTVPDPAAITDAYATIKVTSKIKKQISMVLNMTNSAKEAQGIFDKIQKVASQNIGNGLELNLLGFLPDDKLISTSVKSRTLFTTKAPNSIASMEMKKIVSALVYRLERKVLKNNTGNSIENFFKRLLQNF